MIPEKKTKTNIGVGIGIVLLVAGRRLAEADRTTAIFGLILVLIGYPFFIWGCMNYAEGKGHNKWLGLLGILTCIGLIILIFLPDRHKESK